MEGSASPAGFYYQNNVAALKIIDCLFFNTDITHIRLENYNKGHHIDDIIVYRNNKIEYNQVKWTGDGENSYTLYNLLTAQSPKKSIFRQLAEGYSSVKQNNTYFSITLFTAKRESSQKRPSEGQPVLHISSFLSLKKLPPIKFYPNKPAAQRYRQSGLFRWCAPLSAMARPVAEGRMIPAKCSLCCLPAYRYGCTSACGDFMFQNSRCFQWWGEHENTGFFSDNLPAWSIGIRQG